MARWTESNDFPRIPAAMLEEEARRRQQELESLREPLYARMTAWEPDEHTTDPGVGAADIECVFVLHALEDDED